MNPVPSELQLSRDLDAPRWLVWRALLDPDHVVQHWQPAGATVPRDRLVIEPWLGGRFEVVVVTADGESLPMACTFLEVVEPEWFTFCEPESGIVSTTRLIALGANRTRLSVTQVNVPRVYDSLEARAGFDASLDRLATHLTFIRRADERAGSAVEVRRAGRRPRRPAPARAVRAGTAGSEHC